MRIKFNDKKARSNSHWDDLRPRSITKGHKNLFEAQNYGVRGQVTIFVIIGIVIVVGLVALLLLMNDGVDILDTDTPNPTSSLQSCVREGIEDSVAKIYRNGGEIFPSFPTSYLGEEYNYLCYAGDNPDVNCYNLHPLLELQIEDRIRSDTLDEVQSCFDSLRSDLEGRGFDVTGSATEYFIDLVIGKIKVDLKKDITATKGDSTTAYSDFSFSINDPLYDLVRVTSNIVENEAQFCTFDRSTHMVFYPKYEINVARFGEDKFYRVKDRNSGEEFKFAVRSCPDLITV